MKRAIALLLCTVLCVVMLAGCQSDQDKLVGTWTATADLELAIQTMLAKVDPALSGHIDIEEFKVDIILTFNKDGSYKCTVDQDALESGADRMMRSLSKAMGSYLEQETGMTIDELLLVSGTSMSDLMDTWFDPDMTATLASYLESKGTYEIEDGELLLTDSTGFVAFEFKCSLEKDTLKLTSGKGTDLIANLMPLTFRRQ